MNLKKKIAISILIALALVGLGYWLYTRYGSKAAAKLAPGSAAALDQGPPLPVTARPGATAGTAGGIMPPLVTETPSPGLQRNGILWNLLNRARG